MPPSARTSAAIHRLRSSWSGTQGQPLAERACFQLRSCEVQPDILPPVHLLGRPLHQITTSVVKPTASSTAAEAKLRVQKGEDARRLWAGRSRKYWTSTWVPGCGMKKSRKTRPTC